MGNSKKAATKASAKSEPAAKLHCGLDKGSWTVLVFGIIALAVIFIIASNILVAEYTFKLEKDGVPYVGECTVGGKAVAVSDGSVVVKAGNTLRIDGITEADGYTITEKMKNGYTTDNLFHKAVYDENGVTVRVANNDLLMFLMWWGLLFVLGIAALPLTNKIFPKFADKGWGLSKGIGLLFACITMWTLSITHIMPFSALFCVVSIVIVLMVSVIVGRKDFAPFTKPDGSSAMKIIVGQEILFAALLLFWTFVRGLRPEIYSIEKFMDYGFIMTLLRTDYLPSPDLWLAGENINYYYFGQYIYTFMIKTLGIEASGGYQLALGTTFAATIGFSFNLCYNLISCALSTGNPIYGKGILPKRAMPVAGGIIGSFLIAVGGNGHSFFYGKNHPGNWILQILKTLGLMQGDPYSNANDTYWYPDATRYIGYNPETQDKVIHEFPYYSFLLGDLHAHVCDLAFVIVGVAVVMALFMRNTEYIFTTLEKKPSAVIRSVLPLQVIVFGVMLGIFQMTNFWDYIIYTLFSGVVILVKSLYDADKNGQKLFDKTSWLIAGGIIAVIGLTFLLFNEKPLVAFPLYVLSAAAGIYYVYKHDTPLVRTAAYAGSVMSLSSLTALGFNIGFTMMSNKINIVPYNTSNAQFLVLWGVSLLAAFSLIGYILWEKFPKKDKKDEKAFKRAPFDFGKNITTVDLFAGLLAVWALFCVYVPELFYVVDIYSGHVRSNTMFKFTYQAFMLFGIVIAYAVLRIPVLREKDEKAPKRKGSKAWRVIAIILAFCLIIPACYPFYTTEQCMGKLTSENYDGLEGLTYYGTLNSNRVTNDGSGVGDTWSYVETARWINENIEGLPVIMEMHGKSYTDNCVISAYTGLPTIVGWETHERLWRFDPDSQNSSYQMVVDRQKEVDTAYMFSDEQAAMSILKKYNVEYIILGDLERSALPELNEEKLLSLGEVVYSCDSKLVNGNPTYVIKVDTSLYDAVQ